MFSRIPRTRRGQARRARVRHRQACFHEFTFPKQVANISATSRRYSVDMTQSKGEPAEISALQRKRHGRPRGGETMNPIVIGVIVVVVVIAVIAIVVKRKKQ